MHKKLSVPLFGCLVVGAIALWWWSGLETSNETNVATTRGDAVAINIPDSFSADAQIGKRAFDAKCSVCHGLNAVGKDGAAPPLVHKIYEPNHHGDEAFQRAVELGVRAHHWSFGDMPPVEGLTRADVSGIIAYVRELQQANGIN